MKNTAKIFSVTFVLLFAFQLLQAQVLTFHHGQIDFYTSSVLSDIEAVTEQAEIRLDMESGDFEVKIDISSFEFEYDLMKEHFEEKHMETDKFPNATFSGSFNQKIQASENESELVASGKLTIHGVSKDVELKTKVSEKDGFLQVKLKHLVQFKDFNVEAPSILTKAVAKDVMVNCTVYLH